jgi:hypothetical protein
MEFTQFFYYISYPTFIEYASNAGLHPKTELEFQEKVYPRAVVENRK